MSPAYGIEVSKSAMRVAVTPFPDIALGAASLSISISAVLNEFFLHFADLFGDHAKRAHRLLRKSVRSSITFGFRIKKMQMANAHGMCIGETDERARHSIPARKILML